MDVVLRCWARLAGDGLAGGGLAGDAFAAERFAAAALGAALVGVGLQQLHLEGHRRPREVMEIAGDRGRSREVVGGAQRAAAARPPSATR